MFKIGVLISGGGSNLQAIIDACESGYIPDSRVAVVVSNKKDAYGLVRADKHKIPGIFLDRKEFPSSEEYFNKIADIMAEHDVRLVCLAGFLLMAHKSLIKRFKGRILNIHPALLPKFGGKGMYGHFVHESVIKAGEKESGPTVHFVDEIYDHGEIVLQKKVPVLPGDTPDILAARVLSEEHKVFPEAVKIVVAKFNKG